MFILASVHHSIISTSNEETFLQDLEYHLHTHLKSEWAYY